MELLESLARDKWMDLAGDRLVVHFMQSQELRQPLKGFPMLFGTAEIDFGPSKARFSRISHDFADCFCLHFTFALPAAICARKYIFDCTLELSWSHSIYHGK